MPNAPIQFFFSSRHYSLGILLFEPTSVQCVSDGGGGGGGGAVFIFSNC